MSDFAKVKRTPDDEDYVPPLPEAVILFRKCINELKGSILESLATDGEQEAAKLHDAVNRIQQMGNILNTILSETDPEDESAYLRAKGGSQEERRAIDDIRAHFEQKRISFEDLTPDERDLCRTYIKIDIQMHPYDLNLAHINSQYKSRGGFYER